MLRNLFFAVGIFFGVVIYFRIKQARRDAGRTEDQVEK